MEKRPRSPLRPEEAVTALLRVKPPGAARTSPKTTERRSQKDTGRRNGRASTTRRSPCAISGPSASAAFDVLGWHLDVGQLAQQIVR